VWKQKRPGEKPELLKTLSVDIGTAHETSASALAAVKAAVAGFAAVPPARVKLNHRVPSGFTAHIAVARS